MKANPLSASLTAMFLAGTLLLAGCGRKNSQQANNESAAPATPANTPQAPPAAVNNPQNPPPPPADQTPPPPAPVVIPAGTHVRVRLDQDLGSKISQPGEAFGATVATDVVVNGQTVIPRGTHAEGTVMDAKPLGRFKGGAVLELRLERIRVNGGSYRVASSTIEQTQSGKGKRSAGFIGGGGAFGAIVGGLAGGGKGALIGGLAGAGAGTAGSALTGNREILLPAETLMTFRLEHPVQLTQ